MQIFTERGWRHLQTPVTNILTEAPPRYRGPLPSKACLAYVAELETAHTQWLATRAAMQQDVA